MAEKRFGNLVVIQQGQIGGDHPANKYKPEFCDVVRLLGQAGQFPEEWVCALGVTLRTLYNWANAHPEFEQALHEAHWLCRAFWAQKARDSIQGIGMAPSTLSLILQRRFPDMWGKSAKSMHTHFEERNLAPEKKVEPGEGEDGGIIPPRDVILQRIAELQRRLKERETP